MPKDHPAADPAKVARDAAQSPWQAGRARDLCSTCSDAETCGQAGRSVRPVFFCELFRASAPGPTAGVATPAPGRPAGQQDTSDLKGLCVNCENRKSCAMPKPEGGIWHCEEYR
ncbi:MAG: hypothetical protein AMJ81_05935 [Phycisphaerae bacterium SM23_33]|jgi:hypothetical protein|nr:MAG: hypothetical protein AMJ81_05935 [Phycisphaerae bacterium SM23_33]